MLVPSPPTARSSSVQHLIERHRGISLDRRDRYGALSDLAGVPSTVLPTLFQRMVRPRRLRRDGHDQPEAFRWTAGSGLAGLGFVSVRYLEHRPRGFEEWFRRHGWIHIQTRGLRFHWDAPHGIRRLRDVLSINDYGLDISGWTLRRAQAISADGRPSWYGINPSGQTEGGIANLAPSLLVISRHGNNVALSWETNAIGFVLEQSVSLGSSASWNTNPAPVYVFDRQSVVTNQIDGERRFYRLRKP